MSEAPNRARLTLEQARRAIYVDFEGEAVSDPVVLGKLSTSPGIEWRQAVVDRAFDSAGEAKDLETLSLRAAIDRLAREAETMDACVVAWSWHEWDVFERHGSDDAISFLRTVCRNAKDTAKDWRRKRAPDWTPPQSVVRNRGKHSLAAYMKKMDYVVPPPFGPFLTGDRLRNVREMLDRRGDYQRLTPVAKAKWSKLLKHNAYDCYGMRHVTLQALTDVENDGTDERVQPTYPEPGRR